MKSKLELIKNQFNFRNKSRKSILLSVVALIEIIAIMVVSTYAWVETASTIIIESNGEQQIDSYIYTNADLNSNNAGVIDLSRYYRTSGNMHLASATSSNGSSIFFPRVASTNSSVTGLRQGEISDKNTNYISFNFKVTAKDTDTKLIFDRVPEIRIDGSAVNDNSIRVAINDGSSTKVFSNTSFEGSIRINGTDYPTEVLPFGDYAGNTAVTNNNFVFTLVKGTTKTITVTVWLQDPNKAKEANVTIGDLKLIPHTSSTREVLFTDFTTRFNTSLAGSDISWASNEGTQMWMRDVSRNELTKMHKSGVNGNQWVGYVENKSITQTKGNVEFYNCDSSVASAQVMSNYNCKWTESFANLTSSELASTPDYKAYGRFTDSSAKKGFGTWHSLSEIQLDSEYASALPKPTSISDIKKVTLKTNGGSGNAIEMAYDNSDGYKVWRAYIPNDETTSKNLQFTFTRTPITYTYNAVKRNVTSAISTYVVTSPNTGYWVPPATVKVALASGCENMGKVSVTGGLTGATEVKVTQGTQVTLNAENLPGDDTYGFVAWYSDSTCTKRVGSTSSLTITAPDSETTVTYFAKFMLQHKITLYSLADDDTTESTKGGTVQIKNKTDAVAKAVAYVFDKAYVEIKAEAKPSHNFLGWFNNAEDASPVYDATRSSVMITNVQADVILFAKFAIKTFDIEAQSKYEILNQPSIGTGDKGGTVTINNDSQADSKAYIKVTVNYDGSATFKAYAKDSDGYKFVGWYTDEDCTSANRESTDNPYTVKNIQANKKLYAKFELKTYDVTAHAVSNGTNDSSTYGNVCRVVNNTAQTASNKVTATGIKHGATVTFRANNTSNATFDGWYSNQACTTRLTATDTDVTLANNGKDITLTVKSARNIYAKFTPIKYKATAHAGSNGQVKVGSKSWSTTTSQDDVIKGSSITFYAQPSDGYEFDGWYTAATGGSSVSSNEEFTVTNVSGNIDYYARFKAASKRTIYYYNENNWSTVYAYCWQDAVGKGNQNKDWPGESMTYLGGKVWSYEYSPSSKWDKVIFNCGSDAQKTGNLSLPTNNTDAYYKNSSWTPSSNISHKVTVSSVSNAVVTVTYKTGDNASHTISEGSNAQVYEGTDLTFNATGVTSGYKVTYKVNNADVSGTTYTLDNTAITVTATVTQSGKTIYLKPNSDWNSQSAWFAVFAQGGTWYTMEDAGGGYYSCTLPTNVSKVIFCRMGSKATKYQSSYKWSGDDGVWNQTPGGIEVYETIPTDSKNCFTLNSGWSDCGGSWSTK